MIHGGLAVRRLRRLDTRTLEILERIGHEALGDSALDHWMLPVVARCGMLFVASLGRETVGAAEILICMGDGDQKSDLSGDLYLEGLYISPAHQGKGYGAALLTEVIKDLANGNFRRLLATVDPANEPGRKLYRKAGFRETEKLPDYYGSGRHRLGIELELGGRPVDKERE